VQGKRGLFSLRKAGPRRSWLPKFLLTGSEKKVPEPPGTSGPSRVAAPFTASRTPGIVSMLSTGFSAHSNQRLKASFSIMNPCPSRGFNHRQIVSDPLSQGGAGSMTKIAEFQRADWLGAVLGRRPYPRHALRRSRIPDRGRTVTEIAGVGCRRINDCECFWN
jgi:hypothetical protein